MKYPIPSAPASHSHPTHKIRKDRMSPPANKSQTLNNSPSESNSGPSSQTKVTSNPNIHYEFQEGEVMEGYRVTRQFGEGTFGRVVEGEKKGRRYAIKIIRPVAKYIDSARVEKEILKSLNRRDEKDEEGVVRYKHSFFHNGHFCLVFNPLGASLYELIKKNNYRGFPLRLVQSFLRQILKAVAFVHRLGYTHTDLKPENILLEREELVEDTSRGYSYWLPKSSRVRVIDFGGATLFNEPHSTVICTRQYRPPEVILECCEWNEIADVWSIGCIVAELLTGDLLFPTHSDCEHLVMIAKNSGRFPQWMVNKTASANLRRLFREGGIFEAEAERQLPHWQNISSMKTSDQILGECESLRELVRQCLEIDPNRRINCSAALRHRFFQERFAEDRLIIVPPA